MGERNSRKPVFGFRLSEGRLFCKGLKLSDQKSILFKVASLFFVILTLFAALEWFIWFGVPFVPFWLFKLISNYQFFLFLWNIFLVIAIGFFCPSIIGLSIVLVYSIFRPTSDGACVEQK